MISVIIPVYNAANRVIRTLNCLINQSYSDLEIIIINDGSTDGTEIICDNYASKDNRIKVIHQINKGVSESRNIGLKMSQGEYIGFIDNDDWIHPQYFESLLKAIEKTGCDVSMCYYKKMIEKDLYTTLFSFNIEEDYTIITKEEMFYSLMSIPIDKIRSKPIPYEFIWSKLYKKEVIKNLKFKDIHGEDVEYNSRLYQKINFFTLVPFFGYYWIQHPNSLHKIRESLGIEGYINEYIEIVENIPKNSIWERGLVLKRVMLCLLTSRYCIKKYEQDFYTKNKILCLIKHLKNKYLSEFIKNKSISFIFKFFLLIFIYFPLSYEFFRFIIEKYSTMFLKK